MLQRRRGLALFLPLFGLSLIESAGGREYPRQCYTSPIVYVISGTPYVMSRFFSGQGHGEDETMVANFPAPPLERNPRVRPA